MINKRNLAQMRAHIFSGFDDLVLDNEQARYTIQILEIADRMVDADLAMADERDRERLADAENAFDKALGELLTAVKNDRERLQRPARGSAR